MYNIYYIYIYIYVYIYIYIYACIYKEGNLFHKMELNMT